MGRFSSASASVSVSVSKEGLTVFMFESPAVVNSFMTSEWSSASKRERRAVEGRKRERGDDCPLALALADEKGDLGLALPHPML